MSSFIIRDVASAVLELRSGGIFYQYTVTRAAIVGVNLVPEHGAAIYYFVEIHKLLTPRPTVEL